MRYPLLMLALALPLAGCYANPFDNPNQWSMTSAPRQNLAQQAADKSELIQGHGSPTANGVVAAAAVDAALDQPKGDATGLQKAPPPISFSGSGGS